MDSKLINKTISIMSMETKAGQYGAMAKIKDEKGLTYTVFEQKRDGSTSVAWEQLQKLKIGSLVQISFSEEAKEYEGKGYMARTIRAFDEDVANGRANYEAQHETPRGGANMSSQGPSDENFWDKKAYKQCLWNFWLKSTDVGLILRWEDMVWKAFKDIEADADKRFSEPAPAGTLPVIQQGEDLNVEDIPF
jgi:hypothetical protein